MQYLILAYDAPDALDRRIQEATGQRVTVRTVYTEYNSSAVTVSPSASVAAVIRCPSNSNPVAGRPVWRLTPSESR